MKLRVQIPLVVLCLCAWTSVAQETNSEAAIPNGGFEESMAGEDSLPVGWEHFTSKSVRIGTTTNIKHSGTQSLKMSAQGIPGAFQGVNYTRPVTPESKYSFTAFVINDKNDPLKDTAHGMLVIEWRSADNKEMSRTLSKSWDSSLSKMRWEQFSISNVEPPKGAVSAAFGIHFCEGKKGASGSVFVDDVMLIEK